MALRRSPRFKVPLSLVNLNYDCLFQIFTHLPLPDLLNFRLQCSTMNDAVCKFLPHLATLSILYTEHCDPIESKPSLDSKRKRFRVSRFFRFLSFEQHATINDWLDDACQDFYRTDFRSEDFVIVSGRQQFEKFLAFIKKYESRNITKLALIIDSDPNEFPRISAASDLLELCPKVETLFLERTNRIDLGSTPVFNADDLDRLFRTIVGLTSLKELHFFARKYSAFDFNSFDTREPSSIPQDRSIIGNFLLAMFQKLRILYFNHTDLSDDNLYLSPLFELTLEADPELGLEAGACRCLVNSGTVFKNLRTLTLYGYEADWHFEKFDFIGNSFEKLSTLNFTDILPLKEKKMIKLNALSNLEKLSATLIETGNRCFKPGEIVKCSNKTVKHIQLDHVYLWSPDAKLRRFSDEDRNEVYEVYSFTDFFQSLLTVTVLQPEVVVYDINRFNEIRISGDEKEDDED